MVRRWKRDGRDILGWERGKWPVEFVDGRELLTEYSRSRFCR